MLKFHVDYYNCKFAAKKKSYQMTIVYLYILFLKYIILFDKYGERVGCMFSSSRLLALEYQ